MVASEIIKVVAKEKHNSSITRCLPEVEQVLTCGILVFFFSFFLALTVEVSREGVPIISLGRYFNNLINDFHSKDPGTKSCCSRSFLTH